LSRIKRFARFAAALAGGAIVVTFVTEGRAIAQAARAALVRNQDEPGRNPLYRQTVACLSKGCSLTFPPVPAGQRLVLTFINGGLFTSNGSILGLSGQGSDLRLFPITQAGSLATVNSPMVAYFDAGETPQVSCDGCDDSILQVALSGYYVSLP
jgi:hypothetical protein